MSLYHFQVSVRHLVSMRFSVFLFLFVVGKRTSKTKRTERIFPSHEPV